MGGAGASGAATPPHGSTHATAEGSSPNAKRPATIDPVTTSDGPQLDGAAASRAIYELQRKFTAIENWANGVNANSADHATHIDSLRDKVEGHRVQNHLAFTKVKEAAELAESDLRRVRAEDSTRLP